MIWKQLLKFGMVGVMATFVHMVIGYLLIQAGWHPLFANMLAFAIAFLVSFAGHLGFSFSDQDVRPRTALRRFSVVALIGFGCNQALLVVLLLQGSVSHTVALWVSTGCAAILTFILSKIWAFRTPRQRDVAEPPLNPKIETPKP